MRRLALDNYDARLSSYVALSAVVAVPAGTADIELGYVFTIRVGSNEFCSFCGFRFDSRTCAAEKSVQYTVYYMSCIGLLNKKSIIIIIIIINEIYIVQVRKSQCNKEMVPQMR